MLPPAVMFIDPGGMTGIALLHISFHEDPFAAYEFEFFAACQVIEGVCSYWRDRLGIAWERFTITGQTHKKTPQPDALHMTGVCRYLTAKYRCRFLGELQQASPSPLDRKRLEAIGWWMPGKDDAQSAAAHMLNWLLKNGEMPPREAEILAQLSGR